MIRLFDVITLN